LIYVQSMTAPVFIPKKVIWQLMRRVRMLIISSRFRYGFDIESC
jgi:hypothetical protein